MDPLLREEILGRIYECVLDESSWAETLEVVARATHSAHALLALRNTATDKVFQVIGFPDALADAARAYNEHYFAIDPALQVIDRVPEGGWYIDRQYLGEAAVDKSEFYRDFLRPLGLASIAAPRLSAGPHLEAYVPLVRAVGQRPFERAELEALSPMLAHVRRALRLSAQLGRLRANASLGPQLLDSLRVAALIVDAKGRVRAANTLAEAVLRDNPRELASRNGRLQMPGAPQRLQQALAQACGRHGAAVADAFQLPRVRGLPALEVVVTPLPARLEPMRHAPRRSALVLLHEPRSSLEAGEAFLQGLYGMTPAEARVAAAIVRGATPVQAAQALDVRLPTIRSQLKAVYLKAGVDGQGELVRRLAPFLVVGQ